MNDATALILFSFAVAAVSTGTFVIANAVSEFLVIVVGEAIYGIAVGWCLLRFDAGWTIPMSRSPYPFLRR